MTYKEAPWGKMPENWEIKKISEVTEIVTDYVANGSFASLAENVEYRSEEDYAVLIRLVDYNNDFKGPFVFVDKHAYDFLSKSSLTGGEIIISNVGANVGTVFRCPSLKYKMTLGPNAIIVKFKEDNDFYYYWLKGTMGQFMLQSLVTGSAQPKFNKTNFRDMYVPVPPLKDQANIASILQSIDKKIEVNKQVNDNLLQQAQALYASIFYTNADPNWPSGHLADLITVKYGKDHKKLADGSIPVFGSGGIMRYVERPLYTQESVLIPRKGTLNNVMYVNEPFWSVDTMFYSEMKRANVAKFVYHFLRSKDLASMNAGSAVPSMTTDILNALELVIPPDDVLAGFEGIVAPLYAMIQANDRESSKLAQLRDTLLLRLMSGEIDASSITI